MKTWPVICVDLDTARKGFRASYDVVNKLVYSGRLLEGRADPT